MTTSLRRPGEMFAALLTLIPFGTGDAFKVVEIGSGDGRLAAALLECFPQATLLALEASESARTESTALLRPFADRASVRSFDVASLDWWDLMHGADVVVAALALHSLNDAKKQYLFRATAERLSARGAFLVADLVGAQHPSARRLFDESRESAPLFFQLIWLKHAGFPIADCFWAVAGHAVYGGFKTADIPASDLLSYSTALASVRRALERGPGSAGSS